MVWIVAKSLQVITTLSPLEPKTRILLLFSSRLTVLETEDIVVDVVGSWLVSHQLEHLGELDWVVVFDLLVIRKCMHASTQK